MTTLITGFEPFGGFEVNPSAEIVGALAGEAVTEVLPVEFERCVARVRELMDEHRPEVVLSIGFAPGRSTITLERVAVNLMDARIPDNVGQQPVDEPIVPGAPDGLFTTLPVKAMLTAMTDAGVDAALSLSAGTYGCNAVMFAALEYASRMPEKVRPRCGFMHVPDLDVMPLDEQVRAVRLALAAASSDEQHYAAGTIS